MSDKNDNKICKLMQYLENTAYTLDPQQIEILKFALNNLERCNRDVESAIAVQQQTLIEAKLDPDPSKIQYTLIKDLTFD